MAARIRTATFIIALPPWAWCGTNMTLMTLSLMAFPQSTYSFDPVRARPAVLPVFALDGARSAAIDIPFDLLLRKRLVDEPEKHLQRLGTPDRRALQEVARFRLSHDEGGRALDADGRAVCEASFDSCRVPARRETLIEFRPVHTDRARVLGKLRRGQRPLILEEHLVPLPGLSLLTRTVAEPR